MGKRGGVRVIYFYHDARMPVFLLLVYAKGQRHDMTPDQKRQGARGGTPADLRAQGMME